MKHPTRALNGGVFPGDEVPALALGPALADEDVAPVLRVGVGVAVLVEGAPAVVPDERERLVQAERVAQLHRLAAV